MKLLTKMFAILSKQTMLFPHNEDGI